MAHAWDHPWRRQWQPEEGLSPAGTGPTRPPPYQELPGFSLWARRGSSFPSSCHRGPPGGPLGPRGGSHGWRAERKPCTPSVASPPHPLPEARWPLVGSLIVPTPLSRQVPEEVRGTLAGCLPAQMMPRCLGARGEGGAGGDDGQREGWVFVLRGVHKAGVHASSLIPFLVFLPVSSQFFFHLDLQYPLRGLPSTSPSPPGAEGLGASYRLHPLPLNIG